MSTVRLLPVRLDGRRLTISQLSSVARTPTLDQCAPVSLTAGAKRSVIAARRAFLRHGGPLYGVSSGVGALDSASTQSELERAPLAMLRSHAVGVGPPLSPEVVRAMIVVRAQQLASGHSGVTLELVRTMLALLGHGVTPVVPSVGSIGASDLAPLAYVGLVLAGEGRALVNDRVMEGRDALATARMPPHRFDGRDALGLLNGPALTVARGALAVADARRWLDATEVAAALSLTALGSPASTLDIRAITSKGHVGAVEAAARVAAMAHLEHDDGSAVRRDPLSTRALAHCLGSARDALDHAQRVVEEEISAGIDNPMVDRHGWSTNNASNGDTTRIGLALDHLADAMGTVAAQSERRIARLLSGDGGLPTFLIHPRGSPGVDSGLMIAQYAAAAALAEIAGRQGGTALRTLPVSLGTEDYNPMGPAAAARCGAVVARAADVTAIEILCAAQALDLVPDRLGGAAAALHAGVRSVVEVMVQDRCVGDDLGSVRAWVERGGLDQLDRRVYLPEGSVSASRS